MPKFVVQAGTVGRREGPDRAVRVYRPGDEVELTAEAALALGAQVKPKDKVASRALAEVAPVVDTTEVTEPPPKPPKPDKMKPAKQPPKGAAVPAPAVPTPAGQESGGDLSGD